MHPDDLDNPKRVRLIQQDGFLDVRIGNYERPKTAIEKLNRMFSMGDCFEGWHEMPEQIVELIKNASREAAQLHLNNSHEGGPLNAARPGSTDDFVSINITRLSRFLAWLCDFVNAYGEGGFKQLRPLIERVTKVIELLRAERTAKLTGK